MKLGSGKNIRLFKNPLLEKLTYVHPILPLALWGPVVAYGIFSNATQDHLGAGSIAILFGSGLFFWTLAEYVLHRYIFHFKPRNSWQKRIAFLIHGIHHDDPEDQRRLLMPPAAAIILAVIFYGLFWLVLGSTAVKSFFSGFLVGYLCYDYIHFATHFIRPKNTFLKKLKHNHMQHHFVKPNLLFGVSNPLWDYVFRTK